MVLLRPGHADPSFVLMLLGGIFAAEVSDDGQWIVSAYAGPAGPTFRIRST